MEQMEAVVNRDRCATEVEQWARSEAKSKTLTADLAQRSAQTANDDAAGFSRLAWIVALGFAGTVCWLLR